MPPASCASASGHASCVPTPHRWPCWLGSVLRPHRRNHEPQVAAARVVPGILPDQQRHLRRHQRARGLAPCARSLDGDPADHCLRRRRRALRRPRRAPSARLGPAPGLPGRPLRGHRNDRPVRLGSVERALRLAHRRRDAGRLLQRQCRPLSLRRDRAGGAGLQGEGHLVGAGRRHHRRRRRAEPGAPDEKRAAGRVRRRLRGARARCAGVAGDDLVHPLSAPAPADSGSTGPAAARDRRPSRYSSSPSSPARSATA